MFRRTVVWLITLTLAIVGSQIAHDLAYRAVNRDAAERAEELTATGHGYLTYAPLAFTVAAVLVVAALATELHHILAAPRGPSLRPRAWTFALLAPAIFACQEHFERFLEYGAFPWGAAVTPTFIVGVLLQLPFALAAYAAARLLLRAARCLGRLLARRFRVARSGASSAPTPAFLAIPRVPALALGYGSRGPPALVVS